MRAKWRGTRGIGGRAWPPPPTLPAVLDSETVTAEYTDLMRAASSAPSVMDELARVLAGLDLDPGLPVLELGAGTGLGVVAVAEAVPQAVHAVERSAAMRSLLMSRLAGRPDLGTRVTVHAGDLFDVALPARWGAAVGIHIVCQLEPARRRDFWRLLGERLADGAPALIDRCFGPSTADGFPERMVSTATLGEHEYQRWHSSEPVDTDRVRVRVRYTTVRDGAVVGERREENVHWVARREDVMAEIDAAGLDVTPDGDRFLLLRRR